jgi:dUTP pyrophosphatase
VLLRVKRTRPDATLPRPATPGAAGLDLAAAMDAPITIPPRGRAAIPTGLVLELPEGTEGQVRPRSGLAARHGVTVLNAPGTIDADYRGEVKVLLVNLGDEDFIVHPGDRVAQLVVAPVLSVEVGEADEVSTTLRGAGGFGSTGRA